jgi:hypothetical protein
MLLTIGMAGRRLALCEDFRCVPSISEVRLCVCSYLRHLIALGQTADGEIVT